MSLRAIVTSSMVLTLSAGLAAMASAQPFRPIQPVPAARVLQATQAAPQPAPQPSPTPAAREQVEQIREISERNAALNRSNVQLTLKIEDLIDGTTLAKEVSLVTRNGAPGSLRTTAAVESTATGYQSYAVTLNVDASTTRMEQDLTRVDVTYEYTPAAPPQATRLPTNVKGSIHVVLTNGTPMVVSESTDPVTKRTVRVTLESNVIE